jgi:protein ImuA
MPAAGGGAALPLFRSLCCPPAAMDLVLDPDPLLVLKRALSFSLPSSSPEGGGSAAAGAAAMALVPQALRPLLHPALWRACQPAHEGAIAEALAREQRAEQAAADARAAAFRAVQPLPEAPPTGFAALDAVLPGAGWPLRALTELLLPFQSGIGELRLMAPALATAQRDGRASMWFDPPALPGAPGLAVLGIDPASLVVVRSRPGPGRRSRGGGGDSGIHPARTKALLWALEQALRSGHLGAVVAWLPQRLPHDALRRLQLAAQAHEGPAFVLRPMAAAGSPSAAPLRLALSPAGADRLRVAVLKRRGPPLAAPLTLALPPVLRASSATPALSLADDSEETALPASASPASPPAVAAAAAAAALAVTAAAAIPV